MTDAPDDPRDSAPDDRSSESGLDDLPALPPSVAALASLVRTDAAPPAMRARIEARLDPGPGPGGSGTTGSPGTWAAFGGLAAAAALLIYFALAPRDAAEAVRPDAEPPAATEEPPIRGPSPDVSNEIVIVEEERSGRPASDVPSPDRAAEPNGVVAIGATAIEASPEVEPEPPARRRRAEPSEPSSAPSLDEATLLLRARRSLATAPGDALALCETHAREFPRGQLVDERDVLRIDALRALGRDDEARARATRFLAAHPSSPHRAHLDWATGER
ncbi:MAG: hypothetical protein AB7S26_37735 [Sandaracinaceae bacterium]